jgi:WD40 repeat protein
VNTFFSSLVSCFQGLKCFHLDRGLSILVTGSDDGVVRVWNPVVTKKPIVSLYGHKTDLIDVRILRHMGVIVSFSSDGVVKVWDINDSCCQMTLPIPFPPYQVRSSNNLYYALPYVLC